MERKTLEDFGEKIGGARKDLWSARGLNISDLTGMNDAERKKYVKKDNVWKRPDYQKMMNGGMSPRVAYFIKTVRDSLPTGPYIRHFDTPEQIAAAQDRFVNFVGSVRDAAMSLKDEKDIAGFYNRNIAQYVIKKPGAYYVDIVPEMRGLIDNKVLGIHKMESLPRLDRAIKLKQFGYSEDQKILDGYHLFQYGGEDVKFASDHDRQQLVVEVPGGRYYAYPTGEKADPANWRDGTWFAIKNGGVAEYNMPDQESLKQAILEKEKASLATAKSTTGRRGRFAPPQLAHVRFAGADFRGGRDMTGQDYLDTFRFRGGEFGNWMSDNDRQTSMNMGFEALAAMAKALNIAVEDISLCGRLAIAFGARGQGAAAAHYEPMREVINLTKMHGAGSLAHEWGHAMDDILNKQIGAGSLDDPRRPGLTEIQQRLHGHMKYTRKEQSCDEQKAAIMAQIDRYLKSARRNMRSWFPLDDRLTPEHVKTLDRLIAAVLDDTSIQTRSAGSEPPKSVEELSAFRKAVTSRVIPKEARTDICLAVGMANSARASLETLTPRMVPAKSQYLKDSEKFDDEYSKTEHGYWQSEIEMFARAFACFVHDRLTEAGIRCDYAVGHAESGPVPHGEERKTLNADFDDLIADFKSRGLLHDYVEPSLAVEKAGPASARREAPGAGEAYLSEDASGQFSLDAMISSAVSRTAARAGRGEDRGRPPER